MVLVYPEVPRLLIPFATQSGYGSHQIPMNVCWNAVHKHVWLTPFMCPSVTALPLKMPVLNDATY